MIYHPGGCGNTGVGKTPLPAEQPGLDPKEPEKALFIPLRPPRPGTAFKGQLESSSESLSQGASVSRRETEKLFSALPLPVSHV